MLTGADTFIDMSWHFGHEGCIQYQIEASNHLFNKGNGEMMHVTTLLTYLVHRIP